jgi:hypothetical protein
VLCQGGETKNETYREQSNQLFHFLITILQLR